MITGFAKGRPSVEPTAKALLRLHYLVSDLHVPGKYGPTAGCSFGHLSGQTFVSCERFPSQKAELAPQKQNISQTVAMSVVLSAERRAQAVAPVAGRVAVQGLQSALRLLLARAGQPMVREVQVQAGGRPRS